MTERNAVTGDYLGMPLRIDALDAENLEFFGFCARGELRLQRCGACGLLRYPPGTGCPWCGQPVSDWVAVEGRGTVYSYTQVHHAIQAAFKPYIPYLVLLVELDEQRGRPSEHEALRVVGNLVTPDARLAPPEIVQRAGIGSRVRAVYKNVAPDLGVPLWTLDENAEVQGSVWRHPQA
ncbi:MAG: Zn-ribbon domain-containing OB-fold protein [Gammaproteobacteria bacterium]